MSAEIVINKIQKEEIKKESNNEQNNVKNNKNNKFILNKKLKKIEQLSRKFDLMLNKLTINNKNKRKNNNNNFNSVSQDKILFEKQRHNDSIMIHQLLNDKKQLEERIEILTKITSASEYSNLIEEIKLKNAEIEKLNETIKQMKKNYEEIKGENKNYEEKNIQLEKIIMRIKGKNDKGITENVKLKETNKEQKKKTPINLMIKENKLLKSFSKLNIEKFNKNGNSRNKIKNNDNFYNLLNEKEKACLKNLFGSNEEYASFSNKLNIINTRNIKVENQLKAEIDNLNKYIKIKDEEIEKLNKQIENKDIIIKSLEKQINELRKKIKY